MSREAAVLSVDLELDHSSRQSRKSVLMVQLIGQLCPSSSLVLGFVSSKIDRRFFIIISHSAEQHQGKSVSEINNMFCLVCCVKLLQLLKEKNRGVQHMYITLQWLQLILSGLKGSGVSSLNISTSTSCMVGISKMVKTSKSESEVMRS